MTPTAPPNSQAQQSKGSSLNTGQTVGLTVGLVALASIIALIIFLLLRRRRRQRDEASKLRAQSPLSTGATRTMSENSRYVLGTDGRRVVEGWEGDAAEPASAGSRRSRLMPVDPRLDPFAPVYQRGDRSTSRESVQTIQDNHDYSRRVAQPGPILRATNPDADT
jgi:cell wall integrity and stress response component